VSDNYNLLSSPDSISEIRKRMKQKDLRLERRNTFFRVVAAAVVGISPFLPYVSFAGGAARTVLQINQVVAAMFFLSAATILFSVLVYGGRRLWVSAMICALALVVSVFQVWRYTQMVAGEMNTPVVRYAGLPLAARGIVDYGYGFYVSSACCILLMFLSAKKDLSKENLLD